MQLYEARLLYEARWPRQDQVISSWWSHGDAGYDADKVQRLMALGYVVKCIELNR